MCVKLRWKRRNHYFWVHAFITPGSVLACTPTHTPAREVSCRGRLYITSKYQVVHIQILRFSLIRIFSRKPFSILKQNTHCGASFGERLSFGGWRFNQKTPNQYTRQTVMVAISVCSLAGGVYVNSILRGIWTLFPNKHAKQYVSIEMSRGKYLMIRWIAEKRNFLHKIITCPNWQKKKKSKIPVSYHTAETKWFVLSIAYFVNSAAFFKSAP